MKQMLKLGLVLAAFAAVACVALAFVNNLTAPAIAKAEADRDYWEEVERKKEELLRNQATED